MADCMEYHGHFYWENMRNSMSMLTICIKDTKKLGMFRRQRQYLEQGTALTLFNSLIPLHFDYFGTICECSFVAALQRRQQIQNRVGRILFRTTTMSVPRVCIRALGFCQSEVRGNYTGISLHLLISRTLRPVSSS